MILVQHDYNNINEPDMTDTFIIKTEHVIQVWDITDGQIGIKFNPTYDPNEYKIILEEKGVTILASYVLKAVLEDKDETIVGRIERHYRR